MDYAGVDKVSYSGLPRPSSTSPSTPTMTSGSSSIGAEAFDFIIMGGGTAGLVLENRLTVDPKVSILVIEAGSDLLKDPKITTPGLATLLYDDAQYDWSFDTVPQVCDSSNKLRYNKSVVSIYNVPD